MILRNEKRISFYRTGDPGEMYANNTIPVGSIMLLLSVDIVGHRGDNPVTQYTLLVDDHSIVHTVDQYTMKFFCTRL